MIFQTSLPPPAGPFQVGYVDLMTPGEATESSLLRIHYPSPANTRVVDPPKWTGEKCQEGLLRFLQTMIWNWPSWANNSEYLLLEPCKKVLSPEKFFSVFNIGWNILGKDVTIPISRSSPLAPHVGSGWPVVVHSHGIGCNRFTMSQLCYQLASKGVIVVSIEHRDGSGFGSYSRVGVHVEDVPHLEVPVDQHEYQVRNKQVHHRCGEVLRAVDVLDKVNSGQAVENVVDESNLMDVTRLQSSMDLTNHLYLMGHSFGGATVLLASSLEPRVKAVLAMDPWMFPLHQHKFEIKKPTLVVNTEKFVNKNNARVIKEAVANYDNIDYAVNRDGVHLSSTDMPCVFTQTALRKGLGFMDKVLPETVMLDTNNFVWNWLKKLIG